MSMDRFVRFKADKFPTREELAKVVQALLNGEGTINNEKPHWIEVTLKGKPSHPLRDFYPTAQAAHEGHDERFFEVFLALGKAEPHISVITRQADDFTNALATTYAEVVARWWEAKLELPT